MGLIIDLGGNPQHDRMGFRYWNPPNGPLGYYLINQVHNKQLSQFLGFWSTLTTALFSYIGTELIGVTVGETQNPRKNVPKAIKRMFFRIVVFYIGGTFVISLTVPSTNKVSCIIGMLPSVSPPQDVICRQYLQSGGGLVPVRGRSVWFIPMVSLA